MCLLCGFLCFVDVGGRREVPFAKPGFDDLHCFGLSFGRHPWGVRSHVRDKPDRTFFTDLDAFVQSLGQHHGFLGSKPQLPSGLLLKSACNEGGRGVAVPVGLING